MPLPHRIGRSFWTRQQLAVLKNYPHLLTVQHILEALPLRSPCWGICRRCSVQANARHSFDGRAFRQGHRARPSAGSGPPSGPPSRRYTCRPTTFISDPCEATQVVLREMLTSARRQIVAPSATKSPTETSSSCSVTARRLCPDMIIICDRQKGSARRLASIWPGGGFIPRFYENIELAGPPLASMHCKALVTVTTCWSPPRISPSTA